MAAQRKPKNPDDIPGKRYTDDKETRYWLTQKEVDALNKQRRPLKDRLEESITPDRKTPTGDLRGIMSLEEEERITEARNDFLTGDNANALNAQDVRQLAKLQGGSLLSYTAGGKTVLTKALELKAESVINAILGLPIDRDLPEALRREMMKAIVDAININSSKEPDKRIPGFEYVINQLKTRIIPQMPSRTSEEAGYISRVKSAIERAEHEMTPSDYERSMAAVSYAEPRREEQKARVQSPLPATAIPAERTPDVSVVNNCLSLMKDLVLYSKSPEGKPLFQDDAQNIDKLEKILPTMPPKTWQESLEYAGKISALARENEGSFFFKLIGKSISDARKDNKINSNLAAFVPEHERNKGYAATTPKGKLIASEPAAASPDLHTGPKVSEHRVKIGGSGRV